MGVFLFMMYGKIYHHTRKIKSDSVNGFCSHILNRKELMSELGVEDYSMIEDDICDTRFSIIIDDLGKIEDLLSKYKIDTYEKLEHALKDYREKHSRRNKDD